MCVTSSRPRCWAACCSWTGQTCCASGSSREGPRLQWRQWQPQDLIRQQVRKGVWGALHAGTGRRLLQAATCAARPRLRHQAAEHPCAPLTPCTPLPAHPAHHSLHTLHTAPCTPCTPLPAHPAPHSLYTLRTAYYLHATPWRLPPVAVCPAGLVLPALCDPHPGLQLLLAVDVPATITVLAEATAGWDAVDTDLRAAAGKPSAEQVSVLVATQVRVSAGWCCVMVMGRAQAEAVQHGRVVCLCAGCGAGAARRQCG